MRVPIYLLPHTIAFLDMQPACYRHFSVPVCSVHSMGVLPSSYAVVCREPFCVPLPPHLCLPACLRVFLRRGGSWPGLDCIGDIAPDYRSTCRTSRGTRQLDDANFTFMHAYALCCIATIPSCRHCAYNYHS